MISEKQTKAWLGSTRQAFVRKEKLVFVKKTEQISPASFFIEYEFDLDEFGSVCVLKRIQSIIQ
ncbi:hypothetical protein P7H16_10110 [Paenibacillus larvae]|nr:hypothetical protein [Paenibacillus larvae]MDT2236530.1 hypothetical protein [Paenibacillus larvae]MDT2247216.1 hypothetical protein [Paenibacillus larvae]MDT2262482.1 hypothetical protein [Paenibacillus larvae]